MLVRASRPKRLEEKRDKESVPESEQESPGPLTPLFMFFSSPWASPM